MLDLCCLFRLHLSCKVKIVNWKRSVNGKKLRRNDNLKPIDNYKIVEIMFISIIGIIAEQVLTAYERPVQWEQ